VEGPAPTPCTWSGAASPPSAGELVVVLAFLAASPLGWWRTVRL
jgi:hypothetical protein